MTDINEIKDKLLRSWDHWIKRQPNSNDPSGRQARQFFLEPQSTRSPLLDFQAGSIDGSSFTDGFWLPAACVIKELASAWKVEMAKERELYQSSNGDRWSLRREEDGRLAIMHYVNLPAGGGEQRIELAEFLKPGHMGPEHQALLQMIGTLVP